jgi:hypothetical protein
MVTRDFEGVLLLLIKCMLGEMFHFDCMRGLQLRFGCFRVKNECLDGV